METASIVIMLLLLLAYAFTLQRGSLYEKILEILIPALTLFPINGIALYAVSFVFGENVDMLRSGGG